MLNLAESKGRFEARRLEECLGWRPEEKPAVQALLGLRRYWSGPLYRRALAAWDALAPNLHPEDMAAAAKLADTIPAAREFRLLDRWLQEELWRIAESSVDARLGELAPFLEQREGDQGTLLSDPAIRYPGYYTETDFHLQEGGIWRDDRGALIYFMGARLVHVGRNDSFELHDAFARSLGDINPQRIVDIGCGYGKTTFSLKKRWPNARVIGLDPALPCLRLARRLATDRELAIDWQQGIAEQMPLESGSQDLATITMVVHEIPPDSIRLALREARRILRPGGKLALLEVRTLKDPLRDILAGWHSMLIGEPWSVPFRALDLADELREAGFAANAVDPWYLPGTSPAVEHDRSRWFTPWVLATATA